MSRKRHRRNRAKPTGVVGPIHLDVGAKTAEFVPVKLPTTKLEIERYILDRAIDVVRKKGKNLYALTAAPVQNAEAHFDFTLPTAKGEEYLDLLEFAPLAGAYATAPTSYYIWDLAEQLLKRLLKKVTKYGYPRRERIHLLAYTTDYRFRPDLNVLSLLALWVTRHPHPFTTIQYYSPDDQCSGEVWTLFPLPAANLKRVDEGALRDAFVLLADFSKAQVDSSGGTVVPLGPPPRRPTAPSTREK
jgi:hypothetical protein